MRQRKKHTLCWDCRNAVPGENRGCAWSEDGEPVDGWDAEPTRVGEWYSGQKHTRESYIVRSCPRFEKG